MSVTGCSRERTGARVHRGVVTSVSSTVLHLKEVPSVESQWCESPGQESWGQAAQVAQLVTSQPRPQLQSPSTPAVGTHRDTDKLPQAAGDVFWNGQPEQPWAALHSPETQSSCVPETSGSWFLRTC